MICPLIVDVSNNPAIIEIKRNPELVGEAPCTTCRYSGKYVIEPNMAKPTTNPTALLVANARKRKSRGGRIASGTRPSTNIKPASKSTPLVNEESA